MRSTYARAQAHYLRWQEEVLFLKEEMRRGPEFMLWKARWWLARDGRRDSVASDLLGGLQAYSARQAAMYAGLAKRLVEQFSVVAHRHGLMIEWSSELLNIVSGGSLMALRTVGNTDVGSGNPTSSIPDDHTVTWKIPILSIPLAQEIADDDSTEESSDTGDDINVVENSDGYESEF